MEPLQSQDTNTKPVAVGTTLDFQMNAKPRTRFDLSAETTKRNQHAVDFPQRRNHQRLEDEEKQQEMEQPRSWLCFAQGMGTGRTRASSQQQETAERFSQRHVRRGKGSANISFAADYPMDECSIANNDDDMSGIVSRGNVSTLTTKTPVATNRGKKLDLLQP
eukprot:CAMPEP_0113654028 /NCGR_PEP_ID=MMETSP0017_2-20120614/28931_1 /TAXON_ID=2856 /ORGANISM="Cylindrotheca closterium" /LENGTH=162 /DNA_ID=CAMNT_0000567135 /DNA_START=14 /DNA_END=498 /DNA_ORIENTATION=+ /assembly_acc=CAM_ASM_000147